MFCWGNNYSGELGLGDEEPRSEPTPVGTDSDWTAVALTEVATCAIRAAEMYCWGGNVAGLLGLDLGNFTATRSTPTRVGDRQDWQRVWAGQFAFCAMDADGKVWCWGNNEWGALGLGYVSEAVAAPTEMVEQGWSDITIADDVACGLKEDRSACC